ncbi:asparagine synthase (glutamine-hydrolyzing) [Leeia aquatica]|uniref:asparagine synthase (glutamine-hydrolyzing) n=1 Tax=Leeia aquatica TaxID=2725557 RepID=A0A847S9L2_9NEIS|nr:asparagine synthase (glutamine-hydrolyzing) [Leeia aquatica]NLR76443.1 asparagine synthase (glutamine-hydrolyzing) [Leeia aquatica]
MCGIAGFFGQRRITPEVIEAMLSALGRRGPDARHHVGWLRDGQIAHEGMQHALLHTRLSIRDPRPEADQPMVSHDQQVWVCYNGEVYGWEEDAQALQAQGMPFRTTSDTEYILNAYLAYGFEGMLSRLRGMFALTIVDWRHGRVWLARDRMGLKPLLYYHQDGELAFGSMVRAVLPYLPLSRRVLSSTGIDAYLAHRYIPAPHTIYRDIQRLENGCYLQYELQTGSLQKHVYWQPEPESGSLFEELDVAIRLRTASDRPVGLFLSSGIDSSVIAARLAAQGYQNIQTFTAAFPGSSLDESALAGQIAQTLGMQNQRIVIPSGIKDDFASIVADLDEPFADPSCIPTWYLSRETSQHVKVVLGGDGGDELFAGYKRYRKHLQSAWRRHFVLPWLSPQSGMARRGWVKWRQELSQDWLSAYSLRFSGFSPMQRRSLQSGYDIADHHWRMPANMPASPLMQLLALDQCNYLPEYILRKADLMPMAHGLEARCPLLDHKVVSRVLALPPAQRFTHPAKLALAPAMGTLESLRLFEQKKRGFNPPLAHWLQHDLRSRAQGLPGRLAEQTGGQLSVEATQAVVTASEHDAGWHENLLQLMVLEESLRQLADLQRGPHVNA